MEYLEPVARLFDVQIRGLSGKGSSAFGGNNNLKNNYETICEDQIDFLFTSDNSNLEISIFRPKRLLGVLIPNQYEKIPSCKDLPLFVGDIIFNGTDIFSMIEFFIGGRVALNPKAAVVVTGERSVSPFSKTTHPATNTFKQEPEIRTNAFGIRG